LRRGIVGVNFLRVRNNKAIIGLLAAAAAGAFVFARLGSSVNMDESTAGVKRITDADFTNEVLRASGPVVVDFYATWCEPCKVLAPMLDRMAGNYTGRIKFVKVNVDESPATAMACGIQPIPTLLFFTKGAVANAIVGLHEEAELKASLDALAGAK